MFQSYSNNLSLQNKRTEIVASFNLGQNFTQEIATNTGLFWLISPTEDTHCYKLIVCFFNIKKHSIDNPIISRIFFFSCETLFRKPRILHLHIFHNAPYFPPPPPPPQKNCLTVFVFFYISPGYHSRPKRN